MAGKTHQITIDGETKSLSEWCAQYGIGMTAVLNRVAKGMDWERAITIPAREYVRKHVPSEAKWEAIRRLEAEGRLQEFRELQQSIKRETRVSRDESFWMALEYFPPLGQVEDGHEQQA